MTISHYPFTWVYKELLDFNKLIMVFKMPLFIFVSGYLFNETTSYKKFLIKKIDGLVKPLFSFLISLTILKIIFSYFSSSLSNDLTELINALGGAFIFGDLGLVNFALWFVGALFLSLIVFKTGILLFRKANGLSYVAILCGLLILGYCYLKEIQFYYLGYVLIFLTYLVLGYGFRKLSDKYLKGAKFLYSNKMLVFPILYLLSLIPLYSNGFEVKLDIFDFQFNFHLVLLSSILGVFSVLYMCKFLEKITVINNLLIYCSKASFFILAYHIFIIEVFISLFDLRSRNPLFHSFLFLLNIVICCSIYFFVKRIPVVRVFFYPIHRFTLNNIEKKFFIQRL